VWRQLAARLEKRHFLMRITAGLAIWPVVLLEDLDQGRSVRSLGNIAIPVTMVCFAVMFWGQVGFIAGAAARSKNQSSATWYLPFQRLEPIY
jgi:hypothetical protein